MATESGGGEFTWIPRALHHWLMGCLDRRCQTSSLYMIYTEPMTIKCSKCHSGPPTLSAPITGTSVAMVMWSLIYIYIYVCTDATSHTRREFTPRKVNYGSVFSLNQRNAQVKPEVTIYLRMLIRHLRTIFLSQNTKHIQKCLVDRYIKIRVANQKCSY